MSWSFRRQLSIILIALIFVGGIFFLLFRSILFPTPLCTDNKKNGTETGIDCGGVCSLVCKDTARPLVVKWVRSFLIAEDVYNAVAYVENQNQNSAVYQIAYEFRLYDENRQFITSRTGTTYIAPNGVSALFEGQIKVGNRTPKYTTVTFTGTQQFFNVDRRALGTKIVARDGIVSDWQTRPKLSAKVINLSSLYTVNNIDVVAILYDGEDNAVGVSKTYLEGLAPLGGTDVYFTWPNPFLSEPVRIELVPRFNVFSLQF